MSAVGKRLVCTFSNDIPPTPSFLEKLPEVGGWLKESYMTELPFDAWAISDVHHNVLWCQCGRHFYGRNKSNSFHLIRNWIPNCELKWIYGNEKFDFIKNVSKFMGIESLSSQWVMSAFSTSFFFFFGVFPTSGSQFQKEHLSVHYSKNYSVCRN